MSNIANRSNKTGVSSNLFIYSVGMFKSLAPWHPFKNIGFSLEVLSQPFLSRGSNNTKCLIWGATNKCTGGYFGSYCFINKVLVLPKGFDVCCVDIDWQVWLTVC